MSQTYPYTRGAPGGVDYVQGQRLNAAEINTIDKNAAQAADGQIWSDTAAAKNFRKSVTFNYTTATDKTIWDPYLKRWLHCTSNGGAPIVLFSYDAQDDWIELTGIPVGSFWGTTSAAASNGVGTIAIGGSPPGAASAAKIRQSSNGGVTWTSRNTIASSTEGVTAMCWHPGASPLFVLGLGSTATTNIETSPDAISWTQRTAPNSVARSALASSGSAVVAVCATGNKCIRSVDAVTWTEGTMPVGTSWRDVTYSARWTKFFAVGTGAIASSADGGVTWSDAGLTVPFTTVRGIAAYGRLLIATGTDSSLHAISVSSDGGATWTRVKSVASAAESIAAGDNQVACVAGGYFFSSIRGGT